MKKVNVLILDDNELVSTEIFLKLQILSENNHRDSFIEICPFHLKIDNCNVKKAAKEINSFVLENEIGFLLLDRSFSHIIDPHDLEREKLDRDFLYKDNSKGGFYIEELLVEWSLIKKSSLNLVKGAIIYTYDDFREKYGDDKKTGEVIKKTISGRIKNILPKKYSEVFLTYSDIYEKSNIDLYYTSKGKGSLKKMGKKNDFMLYGAFVGEILYHKMIHLLNVRSLKNVQSKKSKYLLRILLLFPVFISLNIGSNAIYDSIKYNLTNELTIGLLSLFFGIVIPAIVIFLKPSVLIDLDE